MRVKTEPFAPDSARVQVHMSDVEAIALYRVLKDEWQLTWEGTPAGELHVLLSNWHRTESPI